MTYIDIETAEWAANLLGYRPKPQPYTETPTAVFNRPAWHAKAACRGEGPARWFPPQGGDTREQLALCATCPVRAECLQFAFDQEGPRLSGIWGGMNGRQRAAYKPRKRAA